MNQQVSLLSESSLIYKIKVLFNVNPLIRLCCLVPKSYRVVYMLKKMGVYHILIKNDNKLFVVSLGLGRSNVLSKCILDDINGCWQPLYLKYSGNNHFEVSLNNLL